MESPEQSHDDANMESLTHPEQERDFAMEYGELNEEEKEKLQVIDKQFSEPRFVEVAVPGKENEKLSIEYVVLDARNEADMAEAASRGDRTVVHIPGFTSSYRSPEKFVKLMALRENKRVIVTSLPSTGKSSAAPSDWRAGEKDGNQFAPFAETIDRTLDAVRAEEQERNDMKTTPDVSLVSSSMGSIIATELAARHPEKVRDLVLLHPAGIEEENVLQLAKRYVAEQTTDKAALARSAKLDPKYKQELEGAYQEFFGKTLQEAYVEAGGKGTFNLQDADDQSHRFSRGASADILRDGTASTLRNPLWRAWEVFSVIRAGLLKKLPKVKANTYIINGAEDKLVPPSQFKDIAAHATQARSVRVDEFAGMRHESIYHDARRYSASVGTFLDKMREEEQQTK